MQGFYPITARTSARRRSSSSSSIPIPLSPTAIPLNPLLKVDPHYSNILTESPQSTSTSTVHPYLPVPIPGPGVYSPRTPLIYGYHPQSDGETNTERDFPSVSQSSRRGLLPVKERDYAEGPEEGGGIRTAKRRARVGGNEGIEERDTDEDEDKEEEEKYIFVDPPEDHPGDSSPIPPVTTTTTTTSKAQTTFLPRPGPADPYLSQFLLPITGHLVGGGTQPPSPEPALPPSLGGLRPSAPIRALSAPGVPQGTSLPAPILSVTEKNLAQAQVQPLPAAAAPQGEKTGQGRVQGTEGLQQPIFKIFSAGLDVEGEEMVRRLKEHLGEVLRVQEEVGGMHLRLEGLGIGSGSGKEEGEEGKDNEEEVKGEEVDKREKGVEEIMNRLGALSQTLRTYHHLGTPKLHFPAPSNPSSAYPNSPSTPTGTSRLRSPSNPTAPHPLQSPPNIRSPPQPSNNPGPALRIDRSEQRLKNKAGVENKRVQRLVPTSPASRGGTSGTGIAGPGPSNQNQKHSPKIPSNLDQVTTAEEEEDNDEEIYDSRKVAMRGMNLSSEMAASAGDRGKAQDVWIERTRRDLSAREGFTSSPMEMADRSRPW